MSASHTRELMLYGEQPILPNTETGFRAIWRFGAPRGSTVPQQHRMVRNARKHSNLLRNSPQDCFSQIRDLEQLDRGSTPSYKEKARQAIIRLPCLLVEMRGVEPLS